DVRRTANLSVSGFTAYVVNRRKFHSEYRGHRTDADRHRFLHIRSATSYGPTRIGKIDRAGGDKRRIFTKAVARDHRRFSETFFLHHAKSRDRRSKYRRPRVRRKLQIAFVALETHSRKRKAESFVSLFERPFRGREVIEKLLDHSDGLRTLARKKICRFTHQTI